MAICSNQTCHTQSYHMHRVLYLVMGAVACEQQLAASFTSLSSEMSELAMQNCPLSSGADASTMKASLVRGSTFAEAAG